VVHKIHTCRVNGQRNHHKYCIGKKIYLCWKCNPPRLGSQAFDWCVFQLRVRLWYVLVYVCAHVHACRHDVTVGLHSHCKFSWSSLSRPNWTKWVIIYAATKLSWKQCGWQIWRVRDLTPSAWASLNRQCLLEASPVSDLEDFMVARHNSWGEYHNHLDDLMTKEGFEDTSEWAQT